MENRVLLLQSGGRDSTISAVKLLENGSKVLGVTLSQNAMENTELPKKRAEELASRYADFSWIMGDFTEWDTSIKGHVTGELSESLPRSCLLCALSKITAVVPICLDLHIDKLAMGYTEYQSSWAEQTPLAIELQIGRLKSLGIELLLPAKSINNKNQAEQELIARGLTPHALENPCCISKWGTQFVSEKLITETIDLGFSFFARQNPQIKIVDRIN